MVGLGRVDDALQLVDCCLLPLGRTVSIDNFSTGYARNVGIELLAHGHRELGRAVLEKVCSWYASHNLIVDSIPDLLYQRMQALEELERWGEARIVAEKVLSEGKWVSEARRVIGRAALAAGDSARARTELAWILNNATRTKTPHQLRDAAALAAALGERDRAVTLLREGLTRGDQYDFWLHITTGLESLRELPAYRELIRPRD